MFFGSVSFDSAMLFISTEFLIEFLPVVLFGYYTLDFAQVLMPSIAFRRLRMPWLVAASLVFYAWDGGRPSLVLILGSIGWNFAIGSLLAARRRRGRPLSPAAARMLLWLGVAGDLGALGYYKYTAFFLGLLSGFGIPGGPPLPISLPIGISFYSFTQIAYLVDMYRRPGLRYGATEYGLFVTFFPHLVAGPILHHGEMMPQFRDPETGRFRPYDILVGLSWFLLGFAKKTLLADHLGPCVAAVYDGLAAGGGLPVGEAWLAAVDVVLLFYFDFSAYSDMAIGLGLMLGIRLPLNFASPLKATSMADLWKRWHMTLTRFLRSYVFQPWMRSRWGRRHGHVGIVLTLTLSGFWHGASATFLLWGFLLGLAWVLDARWRSFCARRQITPPAVVGWLGTILPFVVISVLFRAHSLDDGLAIWSAMFGLAQGPVQPRFSDAIFGQHLAVAVLAAAVALFCPNLQQLFAYRSETGIAGEGRWRPDLRWALGIGGIFGIALAAVLTGAPKAFLYFRF